MSLSPQTLYAEFHHCQTLLNPDQTHQTPGLLFELSPPFTRYLIIPIHIIITRTPHLACLQTSTLLCPVTLLNLLPFRTYFSLPACIYFVIPNSNPCPDLLDSDQTSYLDLQCHGD